MKEKILQFYNKTPFYPYLLGFFFIIHFTQEYNLRYTKFAGLWEIILPVIIMAATVFFVFKLLALLLKDTDKAALIASCFIICFFTYQDGMNIAQKHLSGTITLKSWQFLFISVFITLAVSISIIIMKRKSDNMVSF